MMYEIMNATLMCYLAAFQFYAKRHKLLFEEILIRQIDFSSHRSMQDDVTLDRIEFVKGGTKLSTKLLERCILEVNSHISDIEKVVPRLYVDCMVSDFNYAFRIAKDLEENLKSIQEKVQNLSDRRNEQLDAILSLTGFLFLPLSFITAVFGMNFQAEFFTSMLEHNDGTFACSIFMWFNLMVCAFVVWAKGWSDVLETNVIYGHLMYQQGRVDESKLKKNIDNTTVTYYEYFKRKKKQFIRFLKVKLLGKTLKHKRKRIYISN
jgi:hypothetical protein